ncbi:cellulase family glycosylhydrolase [Streptomyces sp. CA-111067]|uniref:cellulase family glycosylhydrolase n=1 Tax=Streptomyces sp. CA-111067 TaxID=3240046 RepID=UPI003D9872AB
MERSFARLEKDSLTDFWIGVNFWSKVGGPRMWSEYDHDVVVKELQVLRDHGLNLTRSFFFWSDFMPEPDVLSEQAVARFEDFLDVHSQLGMRTVPTLLVGHMSGENWDPAWRAGRDLYSDVWLVDRQAWLGEQLARRLAGHPAVAGWLLSNEMPLYGGTAAAQTVSSWARLVVRGLRAGGATQPVSVGDGAWGIESTGVDNGFRLRDLAATIDFAGPHSYPADSDRLRQHLSAAFSCELAAVAGKPVVLEEFGASSDFVSDEQLGHYYRQVLHMSLLGGATGWMAWNNTDYDGLADQPPYSHHPFEMHFGVTDHEGAPKESLRELAAFGALLREVEMWHCTRAATDTALVVPTHVDTAFPFTHESDRTLGIAALRHSYGAAREAGLAPAVVRATDGIGDDARLYLLPSAKQLTAQAWRRVTELAEGGATVYVSYSAGDHDVQRGPWWPGVNELFGVRHGLRYGMVDRIEDDRLTLEFERDFGGIAAGDRLTLPVGGNAHLRGFLPVEPVTAEVLARDAAGRPALLRRRIGDGWLVLCTAPIEAMASSAPAVNPEDTWRLYDALAREAGVRRPVTVADPRVLVDSLVHRDGRRFYWFVSQSDQPLTFTPRGAALTGLDGTEAGEVTLPPFGVRVLRSAA